jgi:alkanesulfonate monooxygenase SsuD/methylene tetrahydromethanopterin reductase-like flavin-dependent oxidoreductase (luciferase family)
MRIIRGNSTAFIWTSALLVGAPRRRYHRKRVIRHRYDGPAAGAGLRVERESRSASNADSLFMHIVSFDTLAAELNALRTAAGPERVSVYCSGHVMCRKTDKEAKEFHHYIVHEMGDWAAIDHILELRTSPLPRCSNR